MGLRPAQGDEKRLGPATTLYETAALPFVIPSEAEGSAVQRTFPGYVFSTERSRISCHAAPDKAGYAPFRKERRMKFANATRFHKEIRESAVQGSAVPTTSLK
jgi:hypothetical protein